MKKFFIIFMAMFVMQYCTAQTNATNLQEKLFYHSSKGLSFIPPLSRPALMYNGKLYSGKKNLAVLFAQLNDETLNNFFAKYKSNKTTADVLGVLGGFVLPLANIIVTANDGKVNWALLASSIVVNGTGGFLKIQAEKNLLLAAMYYDKKMGYAGPIMPQQQTLSFAISLPRRKH